MGQWVTILTFTFPQEAYLAKAKLESEGITVFLKDELTIQVHNFYSNAIGGVKLQVQEPDIEQAIRVAREAGYLENENPRKDMPEKGRLTAKELEKVGSCPICHSTHILHRDQSWLEKLLGFFTKKKYQCFDCDFEWERP